MRTVRFRLAPAALALALSAALPAQAPRARPELVGMSSERLARIGPAMRRLVDSGDVAGVVTLVMRRGRLVELDTAGWLDRDARTPMRANTIFRLASMTKAVTSVAVMILVEEGKLQLNDPVSKYIPSFARMQVAAVARDSAGVARATLAPARRRVTIRQLLSHRSGLTYGFADAGPVGDAYRKAGVADGIGDGTTLAENVDRLAAQPLLFEPGERWEYSLSTDVLGRVVEVVSGMPLDRFVRERITAPLKMTDTDFYVPDDKLARLATPYTAADGRLRAMADVERFSGGRLVMGGKGWRGSRSYFSGGAGLFSTAADYARFCQMLLDGGTLDGVRVLGPKTIELMTASATGDLVPSPLGPGAGFGLGFQVTTDLGLSGSLGSVGTFGWGGIYGTEFWVDPKEQLVGVVMVQVYPNRPTAAQTFRTLAYAAITAAGAR